LVAGGYRVEGGDRGKPVVWRSTDGRTWSEPSKPLSVHDDSRTHAGDMSVRVLRVVGEKLYAAGGSDWRPHMWHSDDQGRSWKRLPNPVHGDLFKDGVYLVDIASDGSSTRALGLEPTVLQLRNDRWQDVTSDEFPNGGVQPFATSVARKGDTTIVAGGRYTAARGDTRERYVGQVWRKTDGAWEPVESEAFEHGHILDV